MLLHSCFSSGLSLQTEVLYNPNLLSIIAFPDDSPVAAPITLLLFFLFHLISPPLGIYCPSIITLPFLLFPPSPFYSASTVTLFNRCLSSCIFFATSDDFISLHCSTCVDAYEHGSSHMPTSFGAAIFTSSSFYSLNLYIGRPSSLSNPGRYATPDRKACHISFSTLPLPTHQRQSASSTLYEQSQHIPDKTPLPSTVLVLSTTPKISTLRVYLVEEIVFDYLHSREMCQCLRCCGRSGRENGKKGGS